MLPAIALTMSTSLLISSCSDSNNTSSISHNTSQLMKQPLKVTISSLDDLNSLFEKLEYSEENWNTVDRAVPRITFKGVSEKWVNTSSELPVETKKTIFFRLMASLILIANEDILHEREIVKKAKLDSQELINIAIKYRVIENEQIELTEAKRRVLLGRVDILPPSLALAQAAEESGWGTSRFALEGNAFFGQWDFSGKGMKPKQQREELGNYGVARFASPLDSVEAYMANINTNAAYEKLRTQRSEIRLLNRDMTGYELAATLDKYSERGAAYIAGLRQMIRYNKLEPLDTMHLSNKKLIHLISAEQ